MKEFETKEQLFKHLKDNKSLYIAEKKAALKFADAVSYGSLQKSGITKSGATKALNEIDMPELDKLMVKVVINTTNILDSHDDVHIPGLWKKTLSENKLTYHIQEHQMKFDKIISDEVKAYTKEILWSELDENYTGKTEALIFDSVVSEDRNETMFENYLKGYVKQHSVGMRYVQLFMCINSEDKYYREEKDNWDKYYPMVVNSDEVNEQGYFWAVTEAKLIEGSAVVLGSNSVTPTISITQIEPSDDTQNKNNDSRENTIDKQEFRNEFKKQINNLLKI